MTKSLFLAGHNTVIIDAANISKKFTDIWETKFKDCVIEYMRFNTDKATCIKRAIASNKEYLIPVIERMSYEFAQK